MSPWSLRTRPPDYNESYEAANPDDTLVVAGGPAPNDAEGYRTIGMFTSVSVRSEQRANHVEISTPILVGGDPPLEVRFKALLTETCLNINWKGPRLFGVGIILRTKHLELVRGIYLTNCEPDFAHGVSLRAGDGVCFDTVKIQFARMIPWQPSVDTLLKRL